MAFPMASISTPGFWSRTNHMGDVLLRAPFFAVRRAINLELNISTYLLSFLFLVLGMILAFQNLDKDGTGIEAVRRYVVMFWGNIRGMIVSGSHLRSIYIYIYIYIYVWNVFWRLIIFCLYSRLVWNAMQVLMC